MEYLISYISIIKDQWGEKFMWLDSGDQFQGGYETKNNDGALMMDIFNSAGLTAATFGNHEFDNKNYTILEKLVKKSNFPYVVANIFNNNKNETKKEDNIFMEHQFPFRVFTVGKVKIGIIGITTMETPQTTKGNITAIKFKDPKKLIEKYSILLRKTYQVNAVILIAHAGLKYKLENNENCSILKNLLKLQNWDLKNSESCGVKGEIVDLINELPEGTVDLVVSGHTHQITHCFIKGVPIVSGTSNGKYVNVVYLSFDEKDYHFLNHNTIIEGPIPICSKVYSEKKICDFPIKEGENYGTLEDFEFHGIPIKKNTTVTNIMKPYLGKLDSDIFVKVFTIPEELAMDRNKENVLGNFILDFVKDATKSDFSILNSGLFRTSWESGIVTKKDIYEMFPFDNYLYTVQMTGKEIFSFISTLQSGEKAPYPTSGIIQYFKKYSHELTNLIFSDGREIEENKIYLVGSIDFCFKGHGDDFNKIDWSGLKPKKGKKFTEELIKYLKTIDNFDGKKYYNENNLRIRYTN